MELSRRKFLALGSATLSSVVAVRAADEAPVLLGQGEFRYRVVRGWGVLDEKTPVKNCHGIVCDAGGNIIVLNDEVTNNFIVYDSAGKLVHKWGKKFLGAHGLSLVNEGGKEVLYFTDLELN